MNIHELILRRRDLLVTEGSSEPEFDGVIATYNITGSSSYILGEQVDTSKIASITIDGVPVVIDVDYELKDLGEHEVRYAFVTSGDIPSNLLNLCDVRTVTFSNNITDIPLGICESDNTLTVVNFPTSLQTIGNSAFLGTRIPSLTLPEGTLSIGSSAFSGNTYLTEVTLPSTIQSIGINAFQYGSIGRVNIPNLLTWLNISFGDNYSNPVSIASTCGLYINGTLLENLVVPNTVTTIKPYTFYHYLNLQSITFNGTETTLGDYAFNQCTGLTGNIVLPSTVTTIGQATFSSCSNVSTFDLPASVTRIGSNAFQSLTSLTSFTIHATTPPTAGRIIFGAASSTSFPIYVPSASVNTYKSASGWSTYASRIQAIPT